MSEDARRNAARYRQDRDAQERAERRAEPTASVPANREQRAAYIETVIEQAIRAGEFDDLPGAGRPLEGLGDRHDPDWWIRRKIESEKLDILGPPALTLRTESRELEGRLDALARESEVRETLEDFNRRVVDARRQLLGGPPVVTPTRDIDAEVAGWRGRRETRAREAEVRRAAKAADAARPGWRERRRSRRARDDRPSLDG